MHLMALPGLCESFRKANCEWPLTIGSSHRGSASSLTQGGGLVIEINQLHFASAQPHVAQSHR
jgi:hypothetical protein